MAKATQTTAKTAAKTAPKAAPETKAVVEEAAAKVEKKVAEVKDEAKKVEQKAVEVKTAAKKAVKKATAKKTEKTTLVPEIYVQFQGREDVVLDVINRVKAVYVAEGHRESGIKSLQVYLKPEESAAYYVINQKYAGKVDLF